jgi:HlyD family secretion protein
MGVHLVFFLHITTGPDNVNNVMALAFGVLTAAPHRFALDHGEPEPQLMGQIMQMQFEHGSEVSAVTASGVVAPTATAPVGARVSGIIQALLLRRQHASESGPALREN